MAAPRERTAYRALVIKGGGGAFYGRLFTIPTYGGEGWAAVGQRQGERTGYAMLHVARGQTEFGLEVTGVHVGPQAEWRFGRARLGGELRVGFLVLRHASTHDIRSNGSLGIAAHASVDMATFDGTDALFAVATLRADDYFEPIAVSGNLSLGYRWES
jgi:hypothetical protein